MDSPSAYGENSECDQRIDLSLKEDRALGINYVPIQVIVPTAGEDITLGPKLPVTEVSAEDIRMFYGM